MVLALSLGLLTWGCGEARERAAKERNIAERQQAIGAYSAAVTSVDALQEQFAGAWREANESHDVDELKKAMQERVLPALRAYVEGLRTMPLADDDMGEIHRGLVDAYAERLSAFEAFADALREDTIVEQYESLLTGFDALSAAEATYRDQLEAYYTKFRVTLVTP